MSGDGVVAHNRRTFISKNVDPTRTHLNIEYTYTPIEQAYHNLFDEALAEYNAKQKRQDRCIDNYYEKIRTGRQEKTFYEVIFQVGNAEDMGSTTENGELAKSILDKFYRSFQERNPNLHVFSAHLHMDEATPHLHVDFIPFTTGSKRGLSTRVSLKQALADQGIVGEGRSLTERDLWVQKEKEVLAAVIKSNGRIRHLDFNPPTPWGVGLDGHRVDHGAVQFQSTHPVGGGTRALADCFGQAAISIHPPRGGWDNSQDPLTFR